MCLTAKQVELVKLLLEEGCSASMYNALTHSTPLHMAVRRRSLEIVTLLLEYGADPLLQDKVSASRGSVALCTCGARGAWRCMEGLWLGCDVMSLSACVVRGSLPARCGLLHASTAVIHALELQYTVHGTVHDVPVFPFCTVQSGTSAYDAAMKLHKDSEIHKAVVTAAEAWRKLRGTTVGTTDGVAGAAGSGANAEASVLDLSVTSYYNKTPDRERVRDFNLGDELNPSPERAVLCNNFNLASSPLQKKLALAGYVEEDTVHPVDTVKAFASPSKAAMLSAEDSVRGPLVRLDTVDQTALNSAVAAVLKATGSPTAREPGEEEFGELPYEARQHRVSMAVEGYGDTDEALPSAAALSTLQDSPVRVPHHTPVAHAPPGFGGQSGKIHRTSFFGGDSAKNNASSPATAAPEITGSAAVARASGIYRTQGSFKATNLGAILPNKSTKDNSAPAVKVTNGGTGTSTPGVATEGDKITETGAEGTTPLRPQLNARKSFKTPDLTPSGSFKSPYTVGLQPASSTKGRKSVIGATPTTNAAAGAQGDETRNAAEGPTSGGDSTETSDFGTPLSRAPAAAESDSTAAAAAAPSEDDFSSPTADMLRATEPTGADFSTPMKGGVASGGAQNESANIVTPARKAMGNSGTITGASTTMKSSLNAQAANAVLSTPTKTSTAGGGAMESKSALAPRRPSNVPATTAVTGSALRSSRYGSLQKAASGRAAPAATGVVSGDASAVTAVGPGSGQETPVSVQSGGYGTAVQSPAISGESAAVVSADIANTTAATAALTTTSTDPAGSAVSQKSEKSAVKPAAPVSPAPPATKEGGSSFKRNSFARKTAPSTPK
jgi:hypothetical protein